MEEPALGEREMGGRLQDDEVALRGRSLSGERLSSIGGRVREGAFTQLTVACWLVA